MGQKELTRTVLSMTAHCSLLGVLKEGGEREQTEKTKPAPAFYVGWVDHLCSGLIISGVD